MRSDSSPTIIGWRERVGLPEWGIRSLQAKIDTGARTSVIDVPEIEELADGRIRFEIVTHRSPRKTVVVTATPVRSSTVKPTNGQPHTRHVCRTKIRIGGVDREAEVSLACRRGMLCRMLIGRRTLGASFYIDPSRKYLLPNRRKRKNART